MLDNMANINKLERQQPVKWPEFSWLTQKDNPDPKRCYQMFAPYISRLGYTDTGRVYSIICPQQGVCSKDFGCMNVEVTVTGQRGWVDETNITLAADMTVTGKIWFSPFAKDHPFFIECLTFFKLLGLPFPVDKNHAIEVTTHQQGNPNQPIFPLRIGETKQFPIPEFAQHYDEAWSVANLEVEIGPITKTNHKIVDDFNELIMRAFNLGSGNMLQSGNVLTWNVWFTPPAYVDKVEWATHAERWRKSIDEGHGSPDGPASAARYYDGSPFNPVQEEIDDLKAEILGFLKKHRESL